MKLFKRKKKLKVPKVVEENIEQRVEVETAPALVEMNMGGVITAIVCPDCGKKFSSTRGLKIHQGRVHPTE